MKIKTTYIYPPIPIRTCDWCAIDDDTYDIGAPIGYGATEIQAIANLLEEMVDRERVEDEKFELLTQFLEHEAKFEPGLHAPKEIM